MTSWNCSSVIAEENLHDAKQSLSSRKNASNYMTMCAQTPICSTSEEGKSLIRISKENKGYTIDLFKGFLTWKRESLTRKEHAFLEKLAEEGQEEDLNRAMKVLCNNEIIFPIQKDTGQQAEIISRNDSAILGGRLIHTRKEIDSGEREENAPSVTRSSSPEKETFVDGVELINSEHGVIIIQDAISDEPYDNISSSSRRAQDEDGNCFETAEPTHKVDEEQIKTPTKSENRNGSSMGSQLRQRRVLERKGSFIHLNMWKAHRQGFSLTPSSSTIRSISKSRQPSPFRTYSASKQRTSVPLELESEDPSESISSKMKFESSLSNSADSIGFAHQIDDPSIRQANPLIRIESVTTTSVASEAATKPSMHRRRSSEGSTRDPSRMRPLRQSSPMRSFLHRSPVTQRMPSPIPGNDLSEFLETIAIQNDDNRNRCENGDAKPVATRALEKKQNFRTMMPSITLDNRLLEANDADIAKDKDINPTDAQLRDVSNLRQCLSEMEYEAPRVIYRSAQEADKEYFDESKLKHYDAWDILEQERENFLPFKILGTSADDEASMPHVLSPPLMESLYDFLPFSCSESNFFMKYSLIRDGASFIPMLQQIRGSKHTILAIETTDGEVFGAFTSTAWKNSADYYGSGESFLWRMKHDRRTLCTSVFDQANLESDVDFFPWTGSNYLVQYCSKERLALGGGNSRKVSNGGFAVAIESTMLYGTSVQSGTFDNPPLSKVHQDGTPFEIVNMEIWSMTPTNSEAEAERLEMATLFLEEHM